MNKRQVIILSAIAAVLALIVGAVKLTSSESTQSATARASGQTLFEKFPATDVAAVTVSGANGTVTLRRKDGKWTLGERDDYPANTTTVNDFIRTVAELKVTRGLEAGPSFAPRFGMDENSSAEAERGLTATFADATGKELATISLGKNIESGASNNSPFGGPATVGRYIRNHADQTGFYAISEMFPLLSDQAARWLDDGFFSPEKIKSVALHEAGSDQPAWEITRESEDGEFKLAGAAGDEVLDTAAAAPMKDLFSYARFNDVIPAAELGNRADEANMRTAVIETFEGITYRLTITPPKPKEDEEGAADEEMLLTLDVSAELPAERKKEGNETEEDAKVKDEAFDERLKALTAKLEKEKSFAGRTFLVGKSTVEPLLKERSDLVTSAEPAENDPTQGSVQELPGGIVTTPPVEAVTPPMAVPQEEQADGGAADENTGTSDD
jgi:hypothetical protein